MTTDEIEEIKAIMREIIREEIASEFAKFKQYLQNSQSNHVEQWQSTKQAYKTLGLDNAEQLRRFARNGLLNLGTHDRDIRLSGSSMPKLQFNIDKCLEVLKQHPAKRKVYKANNYYKYISKPND
jgi:hypothetical protein